MPDEQPLVTRRLVLRRFRPSDRPGLAALNSNPTVMRYVSGPMTTARSDAFVDSVASHWDRHGYGPWAVTLLGTGDLIGFGGLSLATFDAPFTPVAEVGTRLAVPWWGHGYATEALAACIAHGFASLRLPEIVAMTSVDNARSLALIRRLGMTFAPEDEFDHPWVPPGASHRRYALGRLSLARWCETTS